MTERLAERVAADPDAVVVVDGTRSLSYAELDAEANRLANWLIGEGVGPDGLVGLCLDRTVDHVVAVVAVLRTGAAYVPLDRSYPPARLRLMLEHSGVATVLVDATTAGVLPEVPGVRQVDLGGIPPGSDADCGRVVDLDDLAYLMFTSGSTGTPKGVMVTHRVVGNLLGWQCTGQPGRTTAQYAPTSFDVSFQEIFATLLTGGRLVVVPEPARRDLDALLDLVATHRVERWFLPAGVLHWAVEALRDNDVAAGSLRELVLAGEQLTVTGTIRELAARHGWVLRNQYGPTETHVVSEFVLDGDPARWPDLPPIGAAIPGVDLRVLDRDLAPCDEGELFVGGVAVGRGYRGCGGATGERFVPDPFRPGERLYRTGDVARRRADGVLEFVGRVDDQVKVRGVRVEPGEVAAVLSAEPGVREVRVVVREDVPGTRRLVAYVVGAVDRAELRSRAARVLPEHLVPAAFVVVDELPLTENGKLDRAALPAPATGGRWPEDEVERLIAGVWAEVLGVDRVGASDTFLELGGHSLSASRVVARLRASFPGVTLADHLRHPTVAGLAAALRPRFRVPTEEPVPHRETRALSAGQRGLWLSERTHPGTAAYHVPIAVDLRGPLDQAALHAGLNALTERHSELRACFPLVDGRPVRRISPAGDCPLTLLHAESVDAAHDQVVRAARQPFDLESGPLTRAVLVRVTPEHHLLLWTAHHLVLDGVSVDVLVTELALAHRAAGLPRPPGAYDRYVLHQSTLAGEVRYAESLAYWRERLVSVPPVDLPAVRPRPPVRTLAGAATSVRLGEDLTRRLREYARHSATSLFTVLLTGYAIMVRRHSGQHDLAIGTFLTDRPLPELDRTVGFCVNTVVLRATLTGGRTFTETHRLWDDTLVEAVEHGHVPFDDLVAELAVRDPARHPVFQVAFGFEERPWARGWSLPGLSASPFPVDLGAAKYDLETVAVDHGDSVELRAEYTTDLFDEATVRRMLTDVGTVLDAALAAPDRPLYTLPVDGPPEPVAERTLVVEDDRVHRVFERRVREAPDRVAVTDTDRTMTYAELNAAANRLARVLRGHGVGPEHPVVVHLGRTVDAVVAVLAVLKAGGLYVPLDTTHPPRRLGRTVALSGARIVVSDRPDVPGADALTVVHPTAGAAGSPADLDVPVDGGNLAYLVFTSGSTGEPKGVAVEHRNLVRLFPACAPWLAAGPDDVWSLCHSLAFDVSVWEMWGALLHGGRLVVVPDEVRREPGALLDLLDRHGVTVLSQTPSAFTNLLTEDGAALDRAARSLRAVVFGGEALDFRSLARWTDRFGVDRPCLVNMYGITEITVHGTGHRITAADLTSDRSVIGRPQPDLRMDVVDADLAPCGVGVVGELLVGGAGVARGYWGRGGLTGERFLPDPFRPGQRVYRTGDLVRRRADGVLEYVGRVDSQVKVRGFRVEPGEVESVLLRAPGVTGAVVVGDGDRLVGHVLGDVDVGAVRGFVADVLPEYMVPSLVRATTFPLTANGKVDRDALSSRTVRPAVAAGFVAARDRVERVIAGVWGEVLGVDRVGVFDNFFELGGHSLAAVLVQSHLDGRLPRPVSVLDLFRYPTVAALAGSVTGATTTEPASRDRGSSRRDALARFANNPRNPR
ncbi:non-ribosomal peptide synthetase [Actinophytocola xinjiangensis]|uniref:non-ribosomal peptide synthetase n=1 Tax=Actinophytocola xinjiangensis TaxID=485602 RepID=UPI00138FEFF6|nr:non-ribosomal peptide synthetase [Actinophytocola xinjiangensis]